MFSRRMEQLSGFLALLVITGPFVQRKTHLSATPIIPSLQGPDTAAMNRKLIVLQGESLRIYLFCGQETLNTEKVWCKEELRKGCISTNPLLFSEPEWRVLTMTSNEKVRLGNPKRDCATVHMTSVTVEDSGLYWFGLLDDQNIYDLTPVNMVVRKDDTKLGGLANTHDDRMELQSNLARLESWAERKKMSFSKEKCLSVPSTTVSAPTLRTPSFESPSISEWRLIEVTVVQGEPLSIEGFCGQQHTKTQKVWCKEELLKGCDLKAVVRLLGPEWKYLTSEPNERVVIRDSRNGCVSLFMSDLQPEDSGIYWFGFLDDWNIIPFKKIKVTVQEGQKNSSNVTGTRKKKQRAYDTVLIGSSTVAGILFITSITTLVVLMLTKRHLREDDSYQQQTNYLVQGNINPQLLPLSDA